MKKIRCFVVGILISIIIVIVVHSFRSNKTSQPDNPDQLKLDDVRNEINNRNENALCSDISVDQAAYQLADTDKKYTDEELKKLATNHGENSVTKEQAMEDVDTYFEILKDSYAGYNYFGGDEKFNPAKEEIKLEIQNNEMDEIMPSTLMVIILRNLNFFTDSHLRLNSASNGAEAYCYYESSKMKFYKHNDEYYSIIDGKQWYLEASFNQYMKYTIDKSGEIVYGLFGTVINSSDLPFAVKLKKDKAEKIIEISWNQCNVGKASGKSLSKKDNVNISTIYDMTLGTKTMLEEIDATKKLSENQYGILDLRNNNGGAHEEGLLWLYTYTGQVIDVNTTAYFRNTMFNKYMSNEYVKKTYGNTEYLSKLMKLSEFASKEKDAMDEYTNVMAKMDTNVNLWLNGLDNLNSNNMIDSKTNLFVLQSKEDYSAGELLVMGLKKVKNVITVGSNTNGSIHTGSVLSFYLPNSGISATISRSLLTNLDKDLDTYGIEPDIYISDGNAEDAVLRCIRYYK